MRDVRDGGTLSLLKSMDPSRIDQGIFKLRGELRVILLCHAESPPDERSPVLHNCSRVKFSSREVTSVQSQSVLNVGQTASCDDGCHRLAHLRGNSSRLPRSI